MIEFFELGKIVKPQGIKGEVKLEAYTDDFTRFDYLKTVYIKKDGEFEPVDVLKARYDARSVYLTLAPIKDRNDAELWRGTILFVDRENAAKLPEGAYYVQDLIGLPVFFQDGEKVGVLSDILKTGGTDVYVVKCEGKSLMFPKIEGTVLSVEPEKQIIISKQKMDEVGIYDV